MSDTSLERPALKLDELPLLGVGGDTFHPTVSSGSSQHRPTSAPEVLRSGLSRMREQASRLRALDAGSLHEGLARWARAWSDEAYPWRKVVSAPLSQSLGFSPPMLGRCLEDLFSVWTLESMTRLVEQELSFPACHYLEGGVQRRWANVPATAVFLAGNSLGPAVQSLMACLLARSSVFLKAPSHEPIFAWALICSLAESMPELRECLGFGCWAGAEALSDVLLQEVDQALIFGRAESILALRRRAPAHLRLIERGPRISLAYVEAACADASAARALAEDIVLYERRGCLSPVSILFEGSAVHAGVFAQCLAQVGLEACARLWPCPQDTAQAAAARMQWLGTQSFLSEVYEGGGGAVVLDTQAELSLPPPGRVVWIKPVSQPAEAIRYLRSVGPVLQGAGLAVGPARWGELVGLLSSLGVTRITRLGQLQRPPASWTADGIPVLSSLVRWVSIEE